MPTEGIRNELGESIYGCGEAELPRPEWGRYTERNDILYAHIEEVSIGPIAITGVPCDNIESIHLLFDGSEAKDASTIMGARKQTKTRLISCVAVYQLTGSETAQQAALLAADNLMRRFQEKGGFFQAWGPMGKPEEYRLIADCHMNLPLLFWASEVTGKEEYTIKASKHMETALSVLLRENHSTYWQEPRRHFTGRCR